MKTTLSFVAICLCLATSVFAQDEAVVVPGRGAAFQSRVIVIGPKDSLTAARAISGKVRVMAVFPSTVKATEVEFSVDGKPIGKSNSKPFRADLDTSTITMGEHVLKAVAKDAAGAEAWSASTKARVEASSPPAPERFGNVEVVPVPATPSPTEGSAGPDSSTKPADATTGPAPGSPGASGNVAGSSGHGPVPDKTYTSQSYKFSISYPSAWKVKDDTASRRQNSAFWIVFGDEPIVVNIHAQNLAPDTDQDKFVKHNPYVQSWTRTTVAGRPAFSSTSGTADSRYVAHRLIVLDQGRALMLNCIDKSGRPVDESARLFDAMSRSLRMSAKPAPANKKPK